MNKIYSESTMKSWNKEYLMEHIRCLEHNLGAAEVTNQNQFELLEWVLYKGIAKIQVALDEGATMPTRAHDTDAGADLYARERQVIRARDSAVFDTGVHVEIPHGYCGVLISKSGLNVKHGLVSTGLIDEGYTGSICVKLYNQTDANYIVEKGDKISQLVLIPYIAPCMVQVKSLSNDTDRGNNGFGSTGR